MKNSSQSSPQWLKKETALAKAVSITKRHKKGKSSSPNKKTGPQTIHFFEKHLPGKYRERQGKNFQPYTQYAGQNRDNQTSYQQYNRPGQKLLFHKPRLPGSPSAITPTGKVLEVLHALPQTLLPSLGISLDRDIARQEAQQPLRVRLQHFLPNWQARTNNPWILNTIKGYSLELTSTSKWRISGL